MGAIMCRLGSDLNVSRILLDFESCTPSMKELPIYQRTQSVLQQRQSILDRLSEYTGCADSNRTAMQSPTIENERVAFTALLHNMNNIHDFYLYSLQLQAITPECLEVLSVAAGRTEQAFNEQQALAYALAVIFDFALQFDALRVWRPQISNDVSMYRRLAPKFPSQTTLHDAELNAVSSFTTDHKPMVQSLAKAAARTLQHNSNVTVCLYTMTAVCRNMIQQQQFTQEATRMLLARAMVGSLVLFDHVDQQGAFVNK